MTKEIADKLMNEVLTYARVSGVDPGETLRVFLGAYKEHRKHRGSFIDHPEYANAMTGRYQFMHDRARAYVDAQVAIRNSSPASPSISPHASA